MRKCWVSLCILVALVASVLVWATPAWANHQIRWGAGTTCGTTSNTAAATVGDRVPFIACVVLDGEPLAGWEMTLQVVGPTRSVTAEITTDDSGVAQFAVQPTAAGQTTVSLCDPDGCVYGDTVLSVSDPATTSTSAAAVPEPSSTTTTASQAPTTTELVVVPGASDSTTTTDAASTPGTASPDSTSSSGGLGLWWVLIAVVALYFAAALWYMRPMTIGGTVVDPCARLRRRVAELAGQLADAIAHSVETEKRADQARAAANRARTAGARAADAPDLVNAESEALAIDEMAKSDVRRLRAEHDAAVEALRRCERGEVVADGGDGPASGAPDEAGGGGLTPPPPEPPGCCSGGSWIGFSVSWGGIAVVAGKDAGFVFLYCLQAREIKAILSYSGTRLGVGLGGGAQCGVFFIVRGPTHPSDLQPVVEAILGGVDFDLSIGASVTKLVGAGAKAARSADEIKELAKALRTFVQQSDALRQARKSGSVEDAVAIQAEFSKLLERFDETTGLESALDAMVDATGKGGVSAGQAGGTGANIPLGLGLQVGVWTVRDVRTQLLHIFGCARCSPGNH